MRKSLSLFLAAATLLASLTANSRDFAVSIVGLRQSDDRYNREGLPLVYYTGPARGPGDVMDEPSAHCFFVVVQNLQKTADKMSEGASEWYDCLRFTIQTSSGRTYSVSRLEFAWSANPMQTWIFPGGGMRVIPVDFTNPCWKGLPPLPSEPAIVTMTVTFRYPDANGKSVSVASSPTPVYWCPN